MKVLTAVLLLLLVAVQVRAATYWVGKTGNDGNQHCVNSSTPPAAANTSRTIAQGIGCMSPGDTLYVRSGSYAEQIDPSNGALPGATSWANATTIAAYNGETVSVQNINVYGSSSYRYIIFDGFSLNGNHSSGDLIWVSLGAGYLKFQNVTVTGSGAQGGVHLPSAGAGHNWFTGCTVYDNGNSTAYDHGFYISTPGNLIEHCNIYNNAAYGITIYNGGASGTTNDNVIRFNQIHGNGANSVQTTAGIGVSDGDNTQVYGNLVYNNWGGIQVDKSSGTKVYNNSVYANTNWGLSLEGNANATDIKNNIFYQNTPSLSDSGSGTTQDHNYCNSGCTGTGAINSAANPFVNAPSNFTLSSCSGANCSINNGYDLGSSYNIDYASNTRGQGGGWDIGALEYVSGTIPLVAITGSNAGCKSFSDCTVTQSTVVLSGTTTAVTAGAVTYTTDRGSSGTADWVAAPPPSAWSTSSSPIQLKAGLNHVTIASSDASNNIGTANIAITYVPTFPGNALVAAYGFEEGGGTSATDSSGNGNTGTLIAGATRVDASFGKAVSLNGTTQYVNIPDANSLDLTQSFTLSAWVQPSVSHTDFRAIIQKNALPLNSPYQLYASIEGYCGSGGISGFTNANGVLGNQDSACSSTPLQVNTPTHVALTYDSSSLKLYKNGALIVTTAHSGYMEQSTGSLTIGASEYGEYFQGLIGQVRIYNFAIPLASTNNKVFGAICNAEEYQTIGASIIGDANCPVVAVSPPLNIKVGAAAAGFKIGSGVVTKFGQVP